MRECIDPALLSAVVGGDPTMARELIHDFLPSARADIAAIRQAAAAAQLAEVRSTSHKLKGSCALIGARHLIALCAELQDAAAAGDRARIDRLVPSLESRLTDVERALMDFLDQTGTT